MVKRVFLIALFLWSTQTFSFVTPPVQTKTIESAVDFNLLDLENKLVSLSDFKGRSVLLFFWTTWCPFCRKDLQVLNDMYAELAKEGLEVLAINVGERVYKVANFVKNYNLTYEVLLDEDMAVTENYEILGVPTYIIVDRQGYLRFKGYSFPKERYKDLILE